MTEPVRMSDEVAEGRPRFLWCSLASVEHLRAVFGRGRTLSAARSTYVGLAELAARGYDGKHGGFESVPEEIAAAAGMSDRRVGAHVENLEAVGLLVITRQTGERGQSARSCYRLTEPTVSVAEARARLAALEAERKAREIGTRPGGDGTSPPDFGGDGTSGGVTQRPTQRQDPTRAGDYSEERKEEGGREGERASEPDDQGSRGNHSDTERIAVAAFEALLSQRGQRLSAADRLALRGAIGAAPDGIDLVAVAGRLERNYGPNGKAARQPISSPVGLFCAEIRRSTPAAEEAERPARGSQRRRRSATPIARNSERPVLRVHERRPNLDPPSTELAEAWAHVRSALERSVPGTAWAWLESIGLAGTLTLLVDEAGGESDQAEHVIVLDAKEAHQIGWIAHNAHRCGLIRLLEERVGRTVTVELVPQAASLKKVVAA